MTRIISVCNQKGGVGKTTTAISLSCGLALKKKKVLLIDIDPQSNATSGLGVEKKSVEQSIYNVLLEHMSLDLVTRKTDVKNLWLVPSNVQLTGAEVELVNEMGREYRLKKALAQEANKYDFIIIDCPPSLNLLTINALSASQTVLIPLQCEYYALEGISQLVNTIDLVKNNLNPDLAIEGVLLTMADYRTKLCNQVISEIRGFFKEKVYKAIIPRTIRLGEAPGYGQPIFLYDPQSVGAAKYGELTDEVLKAEIREEKTVSPVDKSAEITQDTDKPVAETTESASVAESGGTAVMPEAPDTHMNN